MKKTIFWLEQQFKSNAFIMVWICNCITVTTGLHWTNWPASLQKQGDSRDKHSALCFSHPVWLFPALPSLLCVSLSKPLPFYSWAHSPTSSVKSVQYYFTPNSRISLTAAFFIIASTGLEFVTPWVCYFQVVFLGSTRWWIRSCHSSASYPSIPS